LGPWDAIIEPMRLLRLAAALFFAAAAHAQDAHLQALHKTLLTLRSTDPTAPPPPSLTIAKHQLRDWIETQLTSLKEPGQARKLSDRINQTLKTVGVKIKDDDQNYFGSLGEVNLTIDSGLVIVTTSLGILCQFDDSVYGYKLVDGRWKRIWESEQNDYSSNKYTPQNISAVHVFQSHKDGGTEGPPFVMTLGNEWGCASNWHRVYYRVWRLDSSSPKLLIDGSEFAFLRAGTYLVGSISRAWPSDALVDVLVEFTQRSIDAGVHSREAIRHYLIDGDQVHRVGPVALSPRDFVDEWLTSAWPESSTWSASPALEQRHGKLHADFVAGQFGYPTLHCQTPDLWQVSVELGDPKKNFEPQPAAYFLVRWRPPYRFTMMNVSDKPWPLCTEEDREADEWRTLFSTQDWRQ
jgi:hypothetical protein